MKDISCRKIIVYSSIFILIITSGMQVIGSNIEIINITSSNYTQNNEIISHAEYEQVTELMVTWPTMFLLKIREEPYFIDIVRAAEKAVEVRINVNNNLYKNRVISKLSEENIPLDNITISITLTNSIWIRDYDPFFIEKNVEISIIDVN